MLISIDYDETYTKDPEFWDVVIEQAKERGHRVICVTARRDTFDHRRNTIVNGAEVVLFAYDCPKGTYAEFKGYYVDIWIDDTPESIS